MKKLFSDARLILALMALPRVGRKTASRLIEQFGLSSEHCGELAAIVTEAANQMSGLRAVSEEDVDRAFNEADEALERASDLSLKVLPLGSPEFPPRLRTIPDPPLVVFLKGNADLATTDQAVAIIGTRQPTEFGLESARRFAAKCAEAGLVVVSGLAKGCDSAAHEGCLDANGKTLAVLAHGLDMVYPASSRKLADRLLDEGGALLSEYPPGTKLHANLFVERDRLQSGLASAVIVVETDVKGGTMHTVGFADKQKRPIACLDHPEHLRGETSTRGTQMLIREKKAMPLTGEADLERLIETVKSGLASGEEHTHQLDLFPMNDEE